MAPWRPVGCAQPRAKARATRAAWIGAAWRIVGGETTGAAGAWIRRNHLAKKQDNPRLKRRIPVVSTANDDALSRLLHAPLFAVEGRAALDDRGTLALEHDSLRLGAGRADRAPRRESGQVVRRRRESGPGGAARDGADSVARGLRARSRAQDR